MALLFANGQGRLATRRESNLDALRVRVATAGAFQALEGGKSHPALHRGHTSGLKHDLRLPEQQKTRS